MNQVFQARQVSQELLVNVALQVSLVRKYSHPNGNSFLFSGPPGVPGERVNIHVILKVRDFPFHFLY